MTPLDAVPTPDPAPRDSGPLWRVGDPLPHSAEAEQGLLGLLLADPKHFDAVADLVRADDFYLPVHGRIFASIETLIARGAVPNPETLHSHFAQEYDLKQVGGGEYLRALTAGIFSAVNLTEYARLIRDYAIRRAVIGAAQVMEAQARGSVFEAPAAQVLEACEASLFALSEDGQKKEAAMPEAIERTLARIDLIQSGKVRSLKTGLAALDRKTTGFWPNDLIILAGRPAMGKTAALCSFAYNMADAGKRGLVFSLEMTAEQLLQRFIARLANIPVGMQQDPGAMKMEHWRAAQEAAQKIRPLPLTIDEESGLSVHQIRARARRHKRRHGLDFIMIDYLGLIRMESQYANKSDQIGEVTWGLKTMAKELDLPVIALHQLNRDVEKRDDKRPTLADLRDSGHIEQDADAVIFLYRDEYYLSKNPPDQNDRESEEKYAERKNRYFEKLETSKGKAEFIVAKLRQGETGIAEARYSGPRQVFYDEE